MGYTAEGIMSQVHLAFGQGTGTVRVSLDACRALADRYAPRIDSNVVGRWETEAVQVLERIRAIGRLAADRTALEGRIEISAADVTEAARRVEMSSMTPQCPPDPLAVTHAEASLPCTPEGILALLFVAMGQGTGPVRVAQDACLAMRERYAPRIDGSVLRSWDYEAVQVLERLRAIGRCAALRASELGSTRILRPILVEAMQRVESVSRTSLCPPAQTTTASVAEPSRLQEVTA
jgi:hypothetical protein